MMILAVLTKKNNIFKKTQDISSLHNFIKHVSSRSYLPVVLVLTVIMLLQINGCSDSGSVGIGTDNSGTQIEIDTLRATQFDTRMLNAYSGGGVYLSAGQFQDPLFGNVFATGLIKPGLASNPDSSSFSQDTKMFLRLGINEETTYGDSLANMSFNLVEITENWRAPAWRLNNEIELATGSPVASFTVTDGDTVKKIPLSDDWVQRYGEFYNRTDSTRGPDFLDQFYGLAIVPQNSGRIITINPDSTEFVINNIEAASDTVANDTLNVGPIDYAFSVDRTNEGEAAETTKIYNTLERVITLDFDFDAIKPINISRVDLVVYRDSVTLKESLNQAGSSAIRPATGPLQLHFVEGDELPQSIDPGSRLTQSGGVYSAKDRAYHFNLTNLIKQNFFKRADSSFTLFLKQSRNDGVIRSNLLFNHQSAVKAPKLIITSTNNR